MAGEVCDAEFRYPNGNKIYCARELGHRGPHSEGSLKYPNAMATQTVRAANEEKRIHFTVAGVPDESAETVAYILQAILNAVECYLPNDLSGEVNLASAIPEWKAECRKIIGRTVSELMSNSWQPATEQPPDGTWCWVTDGSTVWIAKRATGYAGGWTNEDCWEDSDGAVRWWTALVEPAPPVTDPPG